MADKKKQKKIRVIWEEAGEYKSANNLFVAQNADEFCLVFGHFAPPNTTNRTVDEVSEIAYVKPVASLVVSPKNLEAFIALLNEQYELYLKKEENK